MPFDSLEFNITRRLYTMYMYMYYITFLIILYYIMICLAKLPMYMWIVFLITYVHTLLKNSSEECLKWKHFMICVCVFVCGRDKSIYFMYIYNYYTYSWKCVYMYSIQGGLILIKLKFNFFWLWIPKGVLNFHNINKRAKFINFTSELTTPTQR